MGTAYPYKVKVDPNFSKAVIDCTLNKLFYFVQLFASDVFILNDASYTCPVQIAAQTDHKRIYAASAPHKCIYPNYATSVPIKHIKIKCPVDFWSVDRFAKDLASSNSTIPASCSWTFVGSALSDGMDWTMRKIPSVSAQLTFWLPPDVSNKRGGNLPPPFSKLRISSTQIFHVAGRLQRISKYRNNINNSKPPLIIMPNSTNSFFFEQNNSIWFIHYR